MNTLTFKEEGNDYGIYCGLSGVGYLFLHSDKYYFNADKEHVLSIDEMQEILNFVNSIESPSS